jgi:plasmid stabilization system protein ParE
MPFHPAQERAVVDALAAELRRFVETPEFGRSPFMNQSDNRRQARLDAAAPYLTQEQLEHYRQMLDRARVKEDALIESTRKAIAGIPGTG